MKFNKVNGEHLYYMMSNAANKLELQSEYVNSLNVFPVPDGDTGTNMSMTFRAAVKEIEGMDNKNIGEVSKKLAKGSFSNFHLKKMNTLEFRNRILIYSENMKMLL